jgi:hypothetical protein
MKKVSLIGLLLPIIIFSGCEKKGDPTTATIILKNQTRSEYQLWVGHREATPADIVQPGGQISTTAVLDTLHDSEDAPAHWNDEILLNAKLTGAAKGLDERVRPSGPVANPVLIYSWTGQTFNQQ